MKAKKEKTISIPRQLSEVFPKMMNLFYRLTKGMGCPANLTIAQFKVVQSLAQSSVPVRMSDLSTQLSIKQSTLTDTVKKLVTLDLVTRQRPQSDDRVVELSLTANAKKLMKEHQSVLVKVFQMICKNLPEAEAKQLLDHHLHIFEVYSKVNLKTEANKKTVKSAGKSTFKDGALATGQASLLGVFAMLMLGVFSKPAFALSLTEFIAQVESGNDDFKARSARAQGAFERAHEDDLVYAPTFFAKTDLFYDKTIKNNPTFQGSLTRVNRYSLGISKVTSFGTRAALSYNLTYTSFKDTSLAFVPQPQYHEGSPRIEVSQQLWGTGWGSVERARTETTSAKALGDSYLDLFQKKRSRIDAIKAYWRLLAAQKMVLIKQNTLERAKELLKWSERRVSLSLVDRTDLLQAKSAFRTREIELELAKNDLKSMVFQFNAARGVLGGGGASEALNLEPLEDVDTKHVLELQIPQRGGAREDVLAQEQKLKGIEAYSVLLYEKAKPTLEFKGLYSFNSRKTERDDALRYSFQSTYPLWEFGLELRVPLDFRLNSDLRHAAAHERFAAEADLTRRGFEAEQQWQDLNRQFSEVRALLLASMELEKEQMQKLNHEKSRLTNGRTTFYQVLVFETDYSLARTQVVDLKTRLLSLHADLQMFRSEERAAL